MIGHAGRLASWTGVVTHARPCCGTPSEGRASTAGVVGPPPVECDDSFDEKPGCVTALLFRQVANEPLNHPGRIADRLRRSEFPQVVEQAVHSPGPRSRPPATPRRAGRATGRRPVSPPIHRLPSAGPPGRARTSPDKSSRHRATPAPVDAPGAGHRAWPCEGGGPGREPLLGGVRHPRGRRSATRTADAGAVRRGFHLGDTTCGRSGRT